MQSPGLGCTAGTACRQAAALQEWRRLQRGVVKVVTGGGKTLLAMLCITDYMRARPEGQVLVLVPTTALLDQWYVGLVEGLRVPAEQIACFSGEERPEGPGAVNVVVVNTGRQLAPALSARRPTMLVADECHRLRSPANARALDGQHAAALGLSAVPERDYDDGFEARVAPALGPVIFEYSYAEALRDGVISAFQLLNVRVALLPHERDEYDRLTRAVARLTGGKVALDPAKQERVESLLRNRASVSGGAAMRLPVAAHIVGMHRGERILVFHERIGKAEQLASILRARGTACAVYHSGIGPALRRDNLRLYRGGLVDVLITCRALDEGIDVPATTVAIVVSSTASTRQRIQRLGRALRAAPGKELASVYTLYATEPEEKRLATEASRLHGVAQTTWLREALNGIGSSATW